MKVMNEKNKPFTSPIHEINYCNECGDPIMEQEGRFIIEVQWDYYIKDHRSINCFGSKNLCSSCFEKKFGFDNWKNVEPIFKKE